MRSDTGVYRYVGVPVQWRIDRYDTLEAGNNPGPEVREKST